MSLIGAATDSERDVLEKALTALQHSAGFMSAIDVSNAEANISEVRYRPLTTLAIEAAVELADLIGAKGAGFPAPLYGVPQEP